MVISSSKYDVQTTSKSVFHVRMTVIVRQLQREDVGSYRCIAKNSLGEVESNIRLYAKYCCTNVVCLDAPLQMRNITRIRSFSVLRL
ncbi:unnamed protein product [Acanthoscelides obtectus]|nr:unnamed protein product [Acanthoscelides obtectus]CAK1673030.1 hypothetical protein AOBTE_LOCUS29210 [Acanthoscelides obtectus]